MPESAARRHMREAREKATAERLAAEAEVATSDSLLQAAYRELQRNDREFPVQTLTLARDVLAAVLPLHEQRVRKTIAAELRAVIFHCPTHDVGEMPTFDYDCIGCQRHAALVGVAQLVAGHESPSVKAVRELRQVRADDRCSGGDD